MTLGTAYSQELAPQGAHPHRFRNLRCEFPAHKDQELEPPVTMIKPLGNGHPRGPSETYGRRIVPRGPAPVRMRVLAGIFDAGVFLLPLLVGWYVVQSLRDENGGGEATAQCSVGRQ